MQSQSNPGAASPDASYRTINLTFLTHLDIGYTAPPDRLELQHKSHIDDALRLCRMFPDYCYTIECAWLLRQWLKRTDDRDLVAEFVRRVHEGRIEVCGAFASMHSSVMGREDINQLCYEARRLSDELGIEIVTAMQCDVPGYTWGHPQILAKSGIRYFLAGLNTGLGGGLGTPSRHGPLYWEGIDGTRILLHTQTFYTLHHNAILQALDAPEPDMEKTLSRIEEAFGRTGLDSLFFIAAPGDNCGPLQNLFSFERIMEWNARGQLPRIEVTTPRRYIERIVRKYGDTLPVWRGDWPAAYEWDLVKVRAPIATARHRLAQTRLPAVEKLLAVDSIESGATFPRHDVEQAYGEILLYDEHSAPEGHATQALTRREILWSNRIHFMNADRAFNMSEGLLIEAKRRLQKWASRDSDTVVVANDLWWPRTEMVRVITSRFHSGYQAGRRHVDHLVDIETGETVPVDNTDMSEQSGDAWGGDRAPCILFRARAVPAFGVRRYAVVLRDTDPSQAAAEPPRSAGAIIENGRYRVEVDPASGDILSIRDKALARELVGGTAPDGSPLRFNSLDAPPDGSQTAAQVAVVEGATYRRIEIRRPGTWFPATDITLHPDEPRVEFRNVLDRRARKAQFPDEHIWSMKVRLPLGLEPAKARVVVSGPTGHRRVPDDLLEGSDFTTWPSSAFLCVDDGAASVVISSPTDYLFRPGPNSESHFGLETQCVWQMFQVHSRHAGVQVLPFTEPEEEGFIIHDYALTSHAGPFDPRAAERFGWGFRTAMIGHYVPAAPERQSSVEWHSHSFATVSDEDVSIVAFRRSLFAAQDYHILRLQEVCGRPQRRVELGFAPELALEWAREADMVERPGAPIEVRDNAFALDIGPFETATVALGFRRGDTWAAPHGKRLIGIFGMEP
jgi:hypothetical protein